MSAPSAAVRRLAVSLLALTAWLAFALEVVPALITRAYHGTSAPFLNALVISRSRHPLPEYLDYWRNVTWLGCAWCVAVWFVGPVRRWMASPRFFARAVGAATPGALGAIRSWVCGILLAMTVWEDLASTALLPRTMVRPKGLLYLFHALPIGFDRFLASAGALWTFEHLTAFLLLLGVLGLGTRVVLPAAAFCYFVLAGILREYAWFYHTGLIPLYVLVALCFTPCGDGWSLDRVIRIARGRPVVDAGPQARYGWSRYLLWTVVAIPYVAAALSKLYYGGWAWFGADNMRATLLRTTLAPMEFDWQLSLHVVRAPDVVLVALAAFGLFSELLFGLALVMPLARRLVPLGIVATHLGILFLQDILFPDLILLPAIFYDFSVLWRMAGRSIDARVGRVRVLYDGDCGLCGRTVRVLRGLDLLGHLDLQNFRATADPALGPAVDRARLEDEMAVVDGHERVRWGFDAYRVLAWHVPAGWLLLPVLYLPGVYWLGDRAYRYVAARRAGICDVRPDRPMQPPADARVHLRGATASLALAAVLLSWWTTHIEFYPLTTLKMFAALNPPVISYVKPIAVYDDGRFAPARFDKWIGAMADSRYRETVLAPFQGTADRARCDDFLGASIRAANRRVVTGPRVVGIELQFWQWDFAGDPDNPNHGRLVDRYEYRPVGAP